MFRNSGMIIGTKILWPGLLDEVEQSQYFLFFVYPTPEPTESLCIIKIAIIIDRPGLTSTTSVSVLLVCGVKVNIVAENIRIKHHIFHVIGSRQKKARAYGACLILAIVHQRTMQFLSRKYCCGVVSLAILCLMNWSEICILHLSFQKRTRYSSINWPVEHIHNVVENIQFTHGSSVHQYIWKLNIWYSWAVNP